MKSGLKKDSNWFRRRWLDFRNGHSIYLIFAMTFANFITIQYQLLLDRIPVFNSLPIWGFAALFVALYVPLGMVIGYWHRKSQFSVEAEAWFAQNQIGATIYLFLIDLIDGKITQEEKDSMRTYLLKIMKRSDKSIINTSER
jgi:hypothetical protein